MKYFKFKTELKISLSPPSHRTTENKFQFIAVPTSPILESGSIWITYVLSKVGNRFPF
jgi:hypothetical protein